MNKSILITVLFVAIIFYGCSKTAIEGRVIDGFGKPVQGATVKIIGTQFTSQTDESGEYSVSYVPGDISVSITKSGFTDASYSLKIATESTFPAEATTIYEIPEANGMFIISDGVYKPLTPGKIQIMKDISQNYINTREQFTYYIDFNQQDILSIKNSNNPFIILKNNVYTQTLIKLAYDMNGGNWALLRILEKDWAGFIVKGYDDSIQIISQANKIVKNNCEVVILNLPIGNYAFVQYEKRNYTPLQGQPYVFSITN